MNRNQHSDEFREQALSKVRQRGTRSVRDIAEELNMSAGTLRKWWGRSNRALMEVTVTVTVTAERPKFFSRLAAMFFKTRLAMAPPSAQQFAAAPRLPISLDC